MNQQDFMDVRVEPIQRVGRNTKYNMYLARGIGIVASRHNDTRCIGLSSIAG